MGAGRVATAEPDPGPSETDEDRPNGPMGRARSLVERADDVQRRHRWLAIPVAVVRKFGDDRGGNWTALISFYGFLSLFPLLRVFVTVLGFLMRGDPELQRQVLGSTLAQFPVIGTQIERNVHTLTGSGWVLVVGLATATWSGMRVVMALQGAMDEVWNVARRDRPGFLPSRLKALLTLVVVGMALLISGFLAGSGTSGGAATLPLRIVALLVTVVVNALVFAAIFRILTQADVGWQDVIPGAVIGAVGWTALLVAGTWIVDRHVRGATDVYGAFAMVIGLLAWIGLAAQVTLLCAELNVVLERRLWPRSILDRRDTTQPDRRVLAAEATEEAARRDEVVDVRFGGHTATPSEPGPA
jgi:membrane protein